MKVEKKRIGELNKCYSLAELSYRGEHCFLVAAEKQDPCYLFRESGELMEQVWDGPGGVMTIAEVPGTDGIFLATRRFYSPNDGLDAEIVLVEPKKEGGWESFTLCKAPFVHRFGILERGGERYLLVCCLKTGHSFKDDWSRKGACFGAHLPKDLAQFHGDKNLELTLLKDEMLKNHGFSKWKDGGFETGVVACEEGTYLFVPPAVLGAEWQVKRIHSLPSSDSILLDFDGDGKMELGCIAPFHGNSLTIYHEDADGNYVPQWKYPAKEADTEMLHATFPCEIQGKPAWIVGWRKGTRDTILIRWDEKEGNYRTDFLDRNSGCANAMHFKNVSGEDIVIAANREINEIAMYTIS